MSETHEADVRGRRIRWVVTGAGSPLVCVPGLAASPRWWRPIVPALAERREVHLVDLPRYSTLTGFRPADAAGWLVDWLAAAEIERPAVLGHSLGGLLAAQMATRTALERLVLLAPAGLPTGRGLVRETFELVRAGGATPRFLPRIVLDALRCGPENVLRGGLYALAADLGPELGRIDVPTLIVWGDRDRLVPFRFAADWAGAIPDARLAVLDGVAHIPMVEAPERVAESVLAFLGQP